MVIIANSPLGHLLFALKHEGINLAILAQALPKIVVADLESELDIAPNGIYIRKACFLWEVFAGGKIRQTFRVKGRFIPLFDPDKYLTMPGERNSRWRVEFNGIGTLAYCATVERTPQIMALLEHDVMGRAQAFIHSLPSGMLDRAITGGRFTLEMAKRALEVELREETVFLENHDKGVQAVGERHDVRGSDLASLVMMCLTRPGTVSKHRRKQYEYSVQAPVFDYIEEVTQALLKQQALEKEAVKLNEA